jgi:hypothetical protein
MELQENSVKPPKIDSWDVFQENELRSAFANEPEELKYKSASLAVQACASARFADVLARETAGDNVHLGKARPRELTHVVPDRSTRQRSFVHPREEHRLGMAIVLTIGDRSDPRSKRERDPPDSTKKIQAIQHDLRLSITQ